MVLFELLCYVSTDSEMSIDDEMITCRLVLHYTGHLLIISVRSRWNLTACRQGRVFMPSSSNFDSEREGLTGSTVEHLPRGPEGVISKGTRLKWDARIR